MWLLPVVHYVSRAALMIFYRVRVAGPPPPTDGPSLLVANHPNSLLDPAMVAVAAGRPVRFLAKAPLFTDRLIGWMIRGSGSIPVYRRADNPGLMDRNTEMFTAVREAIAAGAAVGIFPEGISHSLPSLAPLKTGAARIALEAAPHVGGAFPLIPVGLTLREKSTFRSEALVVRGDAIAWGDLAGRGPDDSTAVHELTERIQRGMQGVTLNLERWEDAPLLEMAEAIYVAELGGGRDPSERLERLRTAVRVLRRLRAGGDPQWQEVAAAVEEHGAILQRLALTPRGLRENPTSTAAIQWTVRRIPLIVALLSGIAAAGALVFWIPYRLTNVLALRGGPEPDVISTHKVLMGGAVFLGWTILLSVAAGVAFGAWGTVAAMILLPVLAVTTLITVERWRLARRDIRRFFLLRRQAGGDLLAELRKRQVDLAARLDAFRLAAERG